MLGFNDADEDEEDESENTKDESEGEDLAEVTDDDDASQGFGLD